jgi:hypothetical protein
MRDLNVLALVKGAERFVFVYDDDSREDAIAAIRDHAADPAVSLNWFDAAVLTERARKQGEAVEPAVEDSPTSRM